MQWIKRALGLPGAHEPTWEKVFAQIPAAPGTEAAQKRHKQLRKKGQRMTEADEQELNELFYTIYPQFKEIQFNGNRQQD